MGVGVGVAMKRAISNKVEGKNWDPRLSSDVHMHVMTCVCVYTHTTHIKQTENFLFNFLSLTIIFQEYSTYLGLMPQNWEIHGGSSCSHVHQCKSKPLNTPRSNGAKENRLGCELVVVVTSSKLLVNLTYQVAFQQRQKCACWPRDEGSNGLLGSHGTFGTLLLFSEMTWQAQALGFEAPAL